MKQIIALLFGVILLSCGHSHAPKEQTTTTVKKAPSVDYVAVDPQIKPIEKAHQKQAFLAEEAIQFDLKLAFGGKERLNGSLILATNGSKGKIIYQNGNEILFDGEKVYYSKSIANDAGIRFNAYTWPYFFLFPYKLSDEGTNWADQRLGKLEGKVYHRQKLTFDAGTGDDPDDWYELYSDSATHQIFAAAYIVTAGNTVEKAEEDPHAIKYEDYVQVDGIPLASKWTFWGWTEKEGLTKQLGEAMLSNFEFVTITNQFEISNDYIQPKM